MAGLESSRQSRIYITIYFVVTAATYESSDSSNKTKDGPSRAHEFDYSLSQPTSHYPETSNTALRSTRHQRPLARPTILGAGRLRHQPLGQFAAPDGQGGVAVSNVALSHVATFTCPFHRPVSRWTRAAEGGKGTDRQQPHQAGTKSTGCRHTPRTMPDCQRTGPQQQRCATRGGP